MTQERKNAREWCKGIIDILAVIIIILFVVRSIGNKFDIGIDSTDKDGYHRSGLSLYYDYGTGKEYISWPSGCLIERAKR